MKLVGSSATQHPVSWIDICRRAGRTVQLYESEDCRRACRMDLSSGTRPVVASDARDGEYEQGSRVPCEPWRKPTEGELSWLLVNKSKPSDMGRSVSIIRLCDPSSDLRSGVSKRGIAGLLTKICDLNEPLTCIGHSRSSADKRTTTVDTTNNKYIGLHVDNWDDHPIEQRDRAINRVSINVGRNERYFLYLPIAVVEMAKMMAGVIASGRIQSPDYTGLGRLFMERFPEFPVVRCLLAPYEAYIAPTENLVHDGSSEGQHGWDEQFTILGHIGLL